MRSTLAIMLCASLALAACGGKEAEKADIAKDLEKKGTTELLQEVANDKYDPPADGRLTEAQVQMYLKVREKETAIAKVAKEQIDQHAKKAEKKGEKSLAGMMEGLQALGSAADFMTADIRAAKELGYNTQEYLWVKGQVLAASSSVVVDQMSQAMAANMDKAYAEAKKAHDEATDEQTKKLYADMLAGYDQTKKEMQASQQQQDPAIAHNRQLLSKHENALTAYATELSKYENKDGEVKQSLDQWQKEVEKSKQGQ